MYKYTYIHIDIHIYLKFIEMQITNIEVRRHLENPVRMQLYHTNSPTCEVLTWQY